MAVAAPDRLHFTGNDEADELIARDPLALLIGFALDQQVPVQTAFAGPLKIKQRLGTLELARRDPAEVEAAFRETPAVHRFPGSMAGRVQDLARSSRTSTAATRRGSGARRPTRPTCASGSRRCPASAR